MNIKDKLKGNGSATLVERKKEVTSDNYFVPPALK